VADRYPPLTDKSPRRRKHHPRADHAIARDIV
jgi:hypothetical protein